MGTVAQALNRNDVATKKYKARTSLSTEIEPIASQRDRRDVVPPGAVSTVIACGTWRGIERCCAMASETLHEDPAKLGPEVMDRHRAIVSLMEELEAVDWYDQRAKATDNAELRSILEHNRDEEKEHAAMALEWLRRNDPKMDEHLRTFLFKEGPISEIEADMKGGGADGGEANTASDGSLGIGSLRNKSDR